mgnify:CR=1 FL=1
MIVNVLASLALAPTAVARSDDTNSFDLAVIDEVFTSILIVPVGIIAVPSDAEATSEVSMLTFLVVIAPETLISPLVAMTTLPFKISTPLKPSDCSFSGPEVVLMVTAEQSPVVLVVPVVPVLPSQLSRPLIASKPTFNFPVIPTFPSVVRPRTERVFDTVTSLPSSLSNPSSASVDAAGAA